MTTKYYVRPCPGWNPRTGRRVGTRHRWDIGYLCTWCGQFREDVLVKKAVTPTGKVKPCA